MTSFSPKTRDVNQGPCMTPYKGVVNSPRSLDPFPRYGSNVHDFLKFAENNFLDRVSATFSRSEIRSPLLSNHTDTDKKVGLSRYVFDNIFNLRFFC